jgi:hypothetical protein
MRVSQVERAVSPELREAGEGAHIGLLNGVLRFDVVAQDAPGYAVEALVVPLHDGAKGTRGTPTSQYHELGVLENIQTLGLGECGLLHEESFAPGIVCNSKTKVPGRVSHLGAVGVSLSEW